MMKKSYLDLIYHKNIYNVSNDFSMRDSLLSHKTFLSSKTEDLLKDKYFEIKYCDDMENVTKFKKTYRKLKIENILN